MAYKKIWVQVIFDGGDGDGENYDHGRHHDEFARLKNALFLAAAVSCSWPRGQGKQSLSSLSASALALLSASLSSSALFR